MKIIAHIEGEDVTLQDDGSIRFRSKAAVDTDGRGPLHGDPDAQSDTSLHFGGQALNADKVPYIVLPPQVIAAVPGIVLGSQATVACIRTNRQTDAVVGDVGPHSKIGEISVECARRVGIDPSPTTGGEDAHDVEYVVWPGKPAVIDGITYPLQPS